ncbi:unnamed protein product [Ambrosiozyma monospora]|uniref:Unnamed protein product n=1 Tax=Ambrosiozyma monospora TaxID=43982 RepID=A0A9W6YUJ2_AMBMO|nr:unnamed protein product [Ambrosiozyma monospora]
MKLYGSFMTPESDMPLHFHGGMNPLMAMSMSMPNNGWGELVDRIVSGSNKGVAINPRAETLVVQVKEIQNESFGGGRDGSIAISEFMASHNGIEVIKSMAFDPTDPDYDRIYLRVIRAADLIIPKDFRHSKPFITVEMRTSSSKLKFSNGANEKPSANWQFVTTSQDEHIGEGVQILGLSSTPVNENDYLFFDVYIGGEFVGGGKYPLRVYNQLYDTGLQSKKLKSIELYSPSSTGSVGTVEIDLEYVGKNYNVDNYAESLINWKKLYGKSIAHAESNSLGILDKIKRLPLSTIIKCFPSLLQSLLEVYGLASEKHQIISVYGATKENKFQTLSSLSFSCIVHLLDMTLVRQDQYIYLFDEFMKRSVSKVGEFLMSDMNNILNSFETSWTAIGRAICRVSLLMVRISIHAISDLKPFSIEVANFTKSISQFLSSSRDSLISDQLVMIESLELILEAIEPVFFNEYRLVTVVADWSNAIGLKGLGATNQLSTNALANKKKNKEHQLIISKLLFLNRTLHCSLIDTKDSKALQLLYSTALIPALEVLTNEIIDLETSRVALGVMLSALSAAFGRDKRFYDDTKVIPVLLVRLFPIICDAFLRYYDYVRSHKMLKPKREFTQLFPSSYPFQIFTSDSASQDESFSEILVEFTVIMVFLCKMSLDDDRSIPLTYIEQYIYTEELAAFDPFIGSQMKFKKDVPKPTTPQEAIRGDRHLFKITMKALKVATETNYYPSSRWLTLNCLANDTFHAFLCTCCAHVFIPPIDRPDLFDQDFWRAFGVINMGCACAKPASIEHLAMIPTKACLAIANDTRDRAAFAMLYGWTKLGRHVTDEEKQRFGLDSVCGHHRRFYNDDEFSFMSGVLHLALQRNDLCLNNGTKMFWSIIANEWIHSQDLYELERETISALYDIFLSDNKYSPELREVKNFISTLKSLIVLDVEDEAYQPVMKLINVVFEFLRTANELKSIPAGEEFDDSRTFYKINIAGYLMNVDKPELLQSFINSMYDANLKKKNFIQAALSLELLANTYTWDTSSYLPSCVAPFFPSQSEFKRKEALFKLMATNFIKGGKVEQAVDCYEELLEAYKNYNFDLTGLSYCYTELGKAFNALESVGRLESTFFKIAYIGYGFPLSIRNKEFIMEEIVS